MSKTTEPVRELKVFENFQAVSLSQWERLLEEIPELGIIRKQCFKQTPFGRYNGTYYLFVMTSSHQSVYFGPKASVVLGAHVSRGKIADWASWRPQMCETWQGQKEGDDFLLAQPWIVYRDGGEALRQTGAQGSRALEALFEAALKGEKLERSKISVTDRALRLVVGFGLGAVTLVTDSMFLLPVAGLVLFSAVYDRCPLWQLLAPRLKNLVPHRQKLS